MPVFRIFLLALAAFPSLARAEVANPNLLPIGEEEAFLGNAGIAHEESTGATLYNPAGLGFIRHKKVSVYGNAYMGEHTYIRAEARLNGYDIPLDSNTFNPVPLSSVTIFGQERVTYAFSVHVPYSATYEFQMPLQGENTNLSLIGNASISSLWIGPSIGKRVTDSFAWGASLYAIRYSENAVVLDNVNAITNGSNIVGTVGVSQSMRAWSGVAILGAQWALAPGWRAGARVQTQTFDIRGRANFYNVTSGTLNGKGYNVLTNENGYHARHRLPFQLGFGVKTTQLLPAELLADVNFQFPIDYQTAPSRPSFSDRVVTRFTARGNLGAKWRLNETHALLTGLMLNPSALPNGTSTFGSFADSNFKGVTAGLQTDLGVLTTSAGAFVLWSTGEYRLENLNLRSPMERQIYGVILSASYKL